MGVGLRALSPLGRIDESALEPVRLPGKRSLDRVSLRVGDVVIAIRGSLLKAALVDVDFGDQVFASANIAVVRPDGTRLDSAYLWAWLQNLFRGSQFRALSRSSTSQLSVTVKDIGRLSIDLPALADQRQIGQAALALRNLRIQEADVASQYDRVFAAFLSEQFTPAQL